MPIYGYACTSCEHTFDALQKISDPKLVECPDCGESTLQKQLSAPKFRLKGKGWYETDFKTGDKRNLAGDADKKPTSKPKEADKPAKKTATEKTTFDTKTKSA
jgi:putative FmdB family regulatory protein